MVQEITARKAEAHAAMARQTFYDEVSRTYTARCGACGRERSHRGKLFGSEAKTLADLRGCFNYCTVCGKWVCDACFRATDSIDMCYA
jgi:hypothetical protein